MSVKNKKVLVTGADGFIGSHLVEELVRSGAHVRAFVYYNSFNSYGWLDELPKDIASSVEIFTGDVRDPNGVRSACRGVEIVFHLAALIGIPFSYHSPDTYVDTNIKGTLNVLQASRDLGISQVLHTSTSEVYGSALFVPITEDHPLQGQSPYSASKIGADQMALSFYRSFETPVTVIRPFNTYGPRQSARAIIPSIITQIAAGRTTINLGDLSPTRDFTFVRDTARGFIAAAGRKESFGEVINLGSNFEISVGDTAKTIKEVMHASTEITMDPVRMRPQKSEVNRLWADNTKAKKLLDWTPEYAGLEGFRRGISETISWFSNPENLRRYKADVYNI
jgi:NAD dependent epimerase/dehydratase